MARSGAAGANEPANRELAGQARGVAGPISDKIVQPSIIDHARIRGGAT
jgi:hypothetical protein